MQKRINTCRERFGTDYAFQAESVKEKITNTFLDKYGVTVPTKAECIKEKSRRTMKEKLGDNWEEEMKIRRKGGFKRNHEGYENPSQLSDWREKRNNTMMERYGALNRNSFKRSLYIYDGLKFDSSWEVSFYKYCKDFLKVTIIRNQDMYFCYTGFNGTVYRFYPDFYIEDTDEFFEIKGDHLVDENDDLKESWNGVYTHEKSFCIKNNTNLLTSKSELLQEAFSYCKSINFCSMNFKVKGNKDHEN